MPKLTRIWLISHDRESENGDQLCWLVYSSVKLAEFMVVIIECSLRDVLRGQRYGWIDCLIFDVRVGCIGNFNPVPRHEIDFNHLNLQDGIDLAVLRSGRHQYDEVSSEIPNDSRTIGILVIKSDGAQWLSRQQLHVTAQFFRCPFYRAAFATISEPWA